jgi:hypothetical protein
MQFRPVPTGSDRQPNKTLIRALLRVIDHYQAIKLIFILHQHQHLQSTDPSNVIHQPNHQNHSVTLLDFRGKWDAYLVTNEMSSIGGQKKKGIELDLHSNCCSWIPSLIFLKELTGLSISVQPLARGVKFSQIA